MIKVVGLREEPARSSYGALGTARRTQAGSFNVLCDSVSNWIETIACWKG